MAPSSVSQIPTWPLPQVSQIPTWPLPQVSQMPTWPLPQVSQIPTWPLPQVSQIPTSPALGPYTTRRISIRQQMAPGYTRAHRPPLWAPTERGVF